MKVVLKYQINPFFKFVIIKTQLITCYYHLVLHETLNLHLHLQKIQTPPQFVTRLKGIILHPLLVAKSWVPISSQVLFFYPTSSTHNTINCELALAVCKIVGDKKAACDNYRVRLYIFTFSNILYESEVHLPP